jgi:hypothetical protein
MATATPLERNARIPNEVRADSASRICLGKAVSAQAAPSLAALSDANALEILSATLRGSAQPVFLCCREAPSM